MKTTLLSSVLALSSLVVSQAAVVWADDYSIDRAGSPNNYDYAGGAVGTDYNFSLGGNASGVSGGVWNIADTTANSTSGYVAPSQWITRPNDGDQVRFTFDMRVNSLAGLTSPSASVPRVSLFQNGTNDTDIHSGANGAIFTVGFGILNLTTDGDPDTDLALYTVAGDVAAVPNSGMVLGFTGSGWQPGFDFGTYDGTTGTNNTTGAFYRFSLTFTEGSNVVNGTVTNLTTNATLNFTRNASQVMDLSDITNPRDGIRLGSGQGGRGNVDFDNVMVEVLPVPEASTALLVGACGLFGLLRRRR